MDKLLVVIPTAGMVHAHTAVSLVKAVQALPPDIEATVTCCIGSVIQWNRESCGDYGIRGKYDYVLMIDSDMTFPSDAITRLLALGKDIASVHYNRKDGSERSVVNLHERYEADYVYKKTGRIQPDWSLSNMANPFRCIVCGGGMLLIKTAVFKALPKPWFAFGEKNGEPIGEDAYFCDKAIAAGYEVWIDPEIPCGHIGTQVF